MDVPLELDTAYRLLSSPGLASRDSLLPAGPQIIADLHQALRDKTLAPCPPPAEDEADEAAENQAEQSQPGPGKRPAPSFPPPGNPKNSAANPPKPPAKTGIFSAKSCAKKNISSRKTISSKTSAPGGKGTRRAAKAKAASRLNGILCPDPALHFKPGTRNSRLLTPAPDH